MNRSKRPYEKKTREKKKAELVGCINVVKRHIIAIDLLAPIIDHDLKTGPLYYSLESYVYKHYPILCSMADRCEKVVVAEDPDPDLQKELSTMHDLLYNFAIKILNQDCIFAYPGKPEFLLMTLIHPFKAIKFSPQINSNKRFCSNDLKQDRITKIEYIFEALEFMTPAQMNPKTFSWLVETCHLIIEHNMNRSNLDRANKFFRFSTQTLGFHPRYFSQSTKCTLDNYEKEIALCLAIQASAAAIQFTQPLLPPANTPEPAPEPAPESEPANDKCGGFYVTEWPELEKEKNTPH